VFINFCIICHFSRPW